ncbi:GD23280 [Drosophila simulans]|uniref:GD23280 n=1 Tax=Drosophila simulans TaxID=7240 RepID=B4QA64_DROSI|nr:GD23280 [Drosophila simulans]
MCGQGEEAEDDEAVAVVAVKCSLADNTRHGQLILENYLRCVNCGTNSSDHITVTSNPFKDQLGDHLGNSPGQKR